MIKFVRDMFTKNIGMKIIALFVALICWFYIVKELNKGSEEDAQLLNKILPSKAIGAKKLMIKPIFVGKPHSGFEIDKGKVAVDPEYCIVVGSTGMLEKARFIYTVPIDVNGASQSFTKFVPLSPIGTGIYMEETLVQVIVPIQKSS